MSKVRKLDHEGVFIREDLSPEARQKQHERYLAHKAGESHSPPDVSDPSDAPLPECLVAPTGPSDQQ